MPTFDQVRDYLGLSGVKPYRRPSLLSLVVVVAVAAAVGYTVTEIASLPGVVGVIATVVVVLGGLFVWQALRDDGGGDHRPPGSGESLPGQP